MLDSISSGVSFKALSSSQADAHDASALDEHPTKTPLLEPDQKCSEHNLIIHSYHKTTHKLYCTMCIQKEDASDHLLHFPHVVKQIQTKISESLDLNKQRKMQLSSVMSYLVEFQRSNRIRVENKFKDHLQKFKLILTQYEQSCSASLKKAFEN